MIEYIKCHNCGMESPKDTKKCPCCLSSLKAVKSGTPKFARKIPTPNVKILQQRSEFILPRKAVTGGIGLLAIVLVVACINAYHNQKEQRQQGKLKLVEHANEHLGEVAHAVNKWNLDFAQEMLNELSDYVDNSQYADVEIYTSLMEKISLSRQDINQRKLEYAANIKAGLILFEGRMITQNERRHIIEERAAEERRERQRERLLQQQIDAEARQYSQDTSDFFYYPNRQYPYWANLNSKHKTRDAAIQALAKQFEKSTAWIEANMGSSNSLRDIHINLVMALMEPYRHP